MPSITSLHRSYLSRLVHVEAGTQKCSVTKMFLKISQNSQEITSVEVSFLIKMPTCNFIKKETPSQIFFCELSSYTERKSRQNRTNLKAIRMWKDIDFVFPVFDTSRF